MKSIPTFQGIEGKIYQDDTVIPGRKYINTLYEGITYMGTEDNKLIIIAEQFEDVSNLGRYVKDYRPKNQGFLDSFVSITENKVNKG